MKYCIALCIAALAGAAHAQTSPASTLIQACQSLKRQDDRNTCLQEAVKAVAAQQAPAAAPARPPEALLRERAAGVLGAWSALRSVSRLGISYRDYLPYLQRYAIEVDRYGAIAATGVEQDAAQEFDAALQLYTKARDAWRDGIDRGRSYDDEVAGYWAKAERRAGTAQAHIDSGGDRDRFALLAPVEPPPSIYETAAPLPAGAGEELRAKFACRRMVLDGLARPESAKIGDYAAFVATPDAKGGLRVAAQLQWTDADGAGRSGAFDCRVRKNGQGEWGLVGLSIQ